MSLKVIRNEISAVQQELLLKLEIKSIAMLEYTFKHFQPCGKDQIDHTYLNPAECAGNPAQTEKLIKEQRDTIDGIFTFCAKALFLELCVYYKTLAGELHPRTC